MPIACVGSVEQLLVVPVKHSKFCQSAGWLSAAGPERMDTWTQLRAEDQWHELAWLSCRQDAQRRQQEELRASRGVCNRSLLEHWSSARTVIKFHSSSFNRCDFSQAQLAASSIRVTHSCQSTGAECCSDGAPGKALRPLASW